MSDASFSSAPQAPDQVVRASRALALGSLLGLIVLGLAWELWLARTGSGLLALKVLPLLAPLPGLLRHRLYTYRWLSLLVWLYCTEGLVRATSEHGIGQWLATLEVLLCLLLFVACALQVRWRLNQARLKNLASEQAA
ncbi:DUF2069 domain-containing protein [Ideonella azotifigens]|uniref:DUF2069 domain-containing protein n=1 Tax=Ideonella azotifigens TaxID=513160 RepID=A0ABN1K461_9BURK|nr:DUF2069 domain-containing protein [Ideonella azotifigens]MCD2344276.1 DUF2069 domain-containing protein [Ideonella azotifigens]